MGSVSQPPPRLRAHLGTSPLSSWALFLKRTLFSESNTRAGQHHIHAQVTICTFASVILGTPMDFARVFRMRSDPSTRQINERRWKGEMTDGINDGWMKLRFGAWLVDFFLVFLPFFIYFNLLHEVSVAPSFGVHSSELRMVIYFDSGGSERAKRTER